MPNQAGGKKPKTTINKSTLTKLKNKVKSLGKKVRTQKSTITKLRKK